MGDLIISTGMTDKYQDFTLENFKKCNRLFLLQCNSAYPTPPEDCNIAVINEYAKISETNDKIIPVIQVMILDPLVHAWLFQLELK